MKKLVFYNPCQNGDVHVSRTYIQDFINKSKDFDIYYAYKQRITKSDFILHDILRLKKEIIDDEKIYDWRDSTIFEQDNVVYVNTWYGQKAGEYFRRVNLSNCSFHVLYEIFKDVYKHFGLNLEDFYYYLPKVNYENVTVDDSLFDEIKKFRKTVLICSNDVVSGQAPNFSFDVTSRNLAINFPDVLFLSTEDTTRNYDNLINIKKLNLNQISYISSFSDVIVGRSSGPYTFSITHDNILDEKKIFVCFTHDKLIATGLRDGEYKCKLVWSNDFTEDNIYQKIAAHI